MRLPRNIKMLRGPADVSAVAGTLFLLWTVSLLHSSLVIPAGVRVELPGAAGLWGEVLPDLTVAVDAAGRILFEHQVVDEERLLARLREQTAARGTNLTLLLLMDRRASIDSWARMLHLARSAGIHEVVHATSPRPGVEPEVTSRSHPNR